MAATRYRLEAIGRLAHELAISPRHLRLRQLDGIERLAELIEPAKNYPYTLVCYHITGFAGVANQPAETLAGQALLEEAVRFARSFPGVSHLHLEVSETATSALRLYEAAGFTTWGLEPASLCVDDLMPLGSKSTCEGPTQAFACSCDQC